MLNDMPHAVLCDFSFYHEGFSLAQMIQTQCAKYAALGSSGMRLIFCNTSEYPVWMPDWTCYSAEQSQTTFQLLQQQLQAYAECYEPHQLVLLTLVQAVDGRVSPGALHDLTHELHVLLNANWDITLVCCSFDTFLHYTRWAEDRNSAHLTLTLFEGEYQLTSASDVRSETSAFSLVAETPVVVAQLTVQPQPSVDMEAWWYAAEYDTIWKAIQKNVQSVSALCTIIEADKLPWLLDEAWSYFCMMLLNHKQSHMTDAFEKIFAVFDAGEQRIGIQRIFTHSIQSQAYQSAAYCLKHHVLKIASSDQVRSWIVILASMQAKRHQDLMQLLDACFTAIADYELAFQTAIFAHCFKTANYVLSQRGSNILPSTQLMIGALQSHQKNVVGYLLNKTLFTVDQLVALIDFGVGGLECRPKFLDNLIRRGGVHRLPDADILQCVVQSSLMQKIQRFPAFLYQWLLSMALQEGHLSLIRALLASPLMESSAVKQLIRAHLYGTENLALLDLLLSYCEITPEEWIAFLQKAIALKDMSLVLLYEKHYTVPITPADPLWLARISESHEDILTHYWQKWEKDDVLDVDVLCQILRYALAYTYKHVLNVCIKQPLLREFQQPHWEMIEANVLEQLDSLTSNALVHFVMAVLYMKKQTYLKQLLMKPYDWNALLCRAFQGLNHILGSVHALSQYVVLLFEFDTLLTGIEPPEWDHAFRKNLLQVGFYLIECQEFDHAYLVLHVLCGYPMFKLLRTMDLSNTAEQHTMLAEDILPLRELLADGSEQTTLGALWVCAMNCQDLDLLQVLIALTDVSEISALEASAVLPIALAQHFYAGIDFFYYACQPDFYAQFDALAVSWQYDMLRAFASYRDVSDLIAHVESLQDFQRAFQTCDAAHCYQIYKLLRYMTLFEPLPFTEHQTQLLDWLLKQMEQFALTALTQSEAVERLLLLVGVITYAKLLHVTTRTKTDTHQPLVPEKCGMLIAENQLWILIRILRILQSQGDMRMMNQYLWSWDQYSRELDIHVLHYAFNPMETEPLLAHVLRPLLLNVCAEVQPIQGSIHSAARKRLFDMLCATLPPEPVSAYLKQDIKLWQTFFFEAKEPSCILDILVRASPSIGARIMRLSIENSIRCPLDAEQQLLESTMRCLQWKTLPTLQDIVETWEAGKNACQAFSFYETMQAQFDEIPTLMTPSAQVCTLRTILTSALRKMLWETPASDEELYTMLNALRVLIDCCESLVLVVLATLLQKYKHAFSVPDMNRILLALWPDILCTTRRRFLHFPREHSSEDAWIRAYMLLLGLFPRFILNCTPQSDAQNGPLPLPSHTLAEHHITLSAAFLQMLMMWRQWKPLATTDNALNQYEHWATLILTQMTQPAYIAEGVPERVLRCCLQKGCYSAASELISYYRQQYRQTLFYDDHRACTSELNELIHTAQDPAFVHLSALSTVFGTIVTELKNVAEQRPLTKIEARLIGYHDIREVHADAVSPSSP